MRITPEVVFCEDHGFEGKLSGAAGVCGWAKAPPAGEGGGGGYAERGGEEEKTCVRPFMSVKEVGFEVEGRRMSCCEGCCCCWQNGPPADGFHCSL